jgi:PPOX class probable F420-dependent enzyme
MALFDVTTQAGARADQRLRSELIIWLTTVRPDGQPQTSPVWFYWDGEGFLIYSRPNVQKLRNIRRHAQVSLHLDGNGKGGDIVTIEGMAELNPGAPPADKVPEYLDKYRDRIAAIGSSPERFSQGYPDAIRVTGRRARAW